MNEAPDTQRRRPPGTLEHALWYKALTAALCVLMAAASVLIVLELVNRYRMRGAYRVDYEGRIMNKSLTLRETEIGTRATRRLLIRGKGGEEFQVIVNEVLYGRAREGMWIRSSRDGAQLYDSEPPPAPANAEGAEHPSVSAPDSSHDTGRR